MPEGASRFLKRKFPTATPSTWSGRSNKISFLKIRWVVRPLSQCFPSWKTHAILTYEGEIDSDCGSARPMARHPPKFQPNLPRGSEVRVEHGASRRNPNHQFRLYKYLSFDNLFTRRKSLEIELSSNCCSTIWYGSGSNPVNLIGSNSIRPEGWKFYAGITLRRDQSVPNLHPCVSQNMEKTEPSTTPTIPSKRALHWADVVVDVRK